MKYEWVKLRRDTLPSGKGIMQVWARLAARAAFRKGHASYCGYRNAVSPGMWSGGIVGLKSILGVRSRSQALAALEQLSALGYLQYTLDTCTKKLTYQLTDWVVKCSGEACMEGTVYATEGFGFLCLPRSITQRLAEERSSRNSAVLPVRISRISPMENTDTAPKPLPRAERRPASHRTLLHLKAAVFAAPLMCRMCTSIICRTLRGSTPAI